MIYEMNVLMFKRYLLNALFLIFLLLSNESFAQGFVVAPQKLELIANRGRALSIDMILTPSIQTLVAVDVEIKDKNYYKNNENFADIIKFDFEKEVSIEGDELPFSIEITPNFDALGDYEFDLIFAKSTQGIDDLVRLGFIIPLKLRVIGAPLKESVVVREKEFSEIIINNKQKNFFKITLENNGVLTTNAKVKTQVLIKDRKSFRVIANYETLISNIKPNQVKFSRIFLDNKLPNADIKLKTRLTFNSGAVRIFEQIIKAKPVSKLKSGNSSNISIEKPYIEVNLQPRASRYFQNKIYNYSNETVNLQIDFRDDSIIKPLKKSIKIAPYQSTNIVGRIVATASDFSLITNDISISQLGSETITFPVIVRNPTKQLKKSFSIYNPTLKQQKLDNLLSFNYEITGEDFIRPDIQVVVKDELLSTMHRTTLPNLEIGLPGDTFIGKYIILKRISQRPGRYTINFSSDCCSVASDTIKLLVNDDLSLSLEG